MKRLVFITLAERNRHAPHVFTTKGREQISKLNEWLLKGYGENGERLTLLSIPTRDSLIPVREMAGMISSAGSVYELDIGHQTNDTLDKLYRVIGVGCIYRYFDGGQAYAFLHTFGKAIANTIKSHSSWNASDTIVVLGQQPIVPAASMYLLNNDREHGTHDQTKLCYYALTPGEPYVLDLSTNRYEFETLSAV
jgi:hypothetical protein